MICGGAEAAITPMSIGGFGNMKALSFRNDDPGHACRPWDVDRDGFVVGEGAGVLVLEELEHAKRRGAPTVDVDGVAHRLKGVETDAQRQGHNCHKGRAYME